MAVGPLPLSHVYIFYVLVSLVFSLMKDKGLVIYYGDRVLQNGKIVCPKHFALPLKIG